MIIDVQQSDNEFKKVSLILLVDKYSFLSVWHRFRSAKLRYFKKKYGKRIHYSYRFVSTCEDNIFYLHFVGFFPEELILLFVNFCKKSFPQIGA